MADEHTETFEQRLTMLEAELQQTKQCVRAFEDWRKRLKRTCIIMTGGAAALVLLLTQIVPASGNGPTIFKGPVYFETYGGTKLAAINDPAINGLGGRIDFWDFSGGHIAHLGSNPGGTASVGIISDKYRAYMTIDQTGPALRLDDEGGAKVLAELESGPDKAGMGLTMFNTKGSAVVDLGVNTHERGLLQLADENAAIRVEAGTEEDGSAVVKVAGAEGKCAAIGPIACMLLSR